MPPVRRADSLRNSTNSLSSAPRTTQSLSSRTSRRNAITEMTPLSSRNVPLPSPTFSADVDGSKQSLDTPRSSYESSMDPKDMKPVPRLTLPIERRPDTPFNSTFAEIGFVLSMSLTQFLAEYLISGFGVILPAITEHWSDSRISPLWPTTVLSLVMSALTLPFARISDMYGSWPCFIVGLVWLSAFSAAAGLANNELSLNVYRAMQGLAIAAFEPASFTLMGSTYPAGRRRNIMFGIYAAMASVGFFGGMMVSGIALHFNRWGWYFYTAAICAGLAAILAFITAPKSSWSIRNRYLTMDWYGSLLIVSGLILLSYALAASPYAEDGWRSADVLAPFLIGITCLVCLVWVELNSCLCPLLPTDFFKPTNTTAILLAEVCFFASFGVFLFYSTFYMENVMHASPLRMVAYFTPVAVGGVVCSLVSGWLSDRMSLRYLLMCSGCAWILAPLLIAVSPDSTRYFPWIFIAMCLISVGVDLTYTVTSVFLSSVQPEKYQGLAGAINSVALNLAIAFSLSLGGIVEASIAGQGAEKSLKSVFWFAVGLAGAGALIVVLFVRNVRLKPVLADDEITLCDLPRWKASDESVISRQAGSSVDPEEYEDQQARKAELEAWMMRMEARSLFDEGQ